MFIKEDTPPSSMESNSRRHLAGRGIICLLGDYKTQSKCVCLVCVCVCVFVWRPVGWVDMMTDDHEDHTENY